MCGGNCVISRTSRKNPSQHKHHLHSLKDSHVKEIEKTEEQFRHFLAEKDSAVEQFCQDFSLYYEKKKAETVQYEEELLALYELVQQLSRLVHDMETGNYPVCYKSGVKCVQLPPGARY